MTDEDLKGTVDKLTRHYEDKAKASFDVWVYEQGLPDIETVSAEVHQAWMESKHSAGVTSRKSETGEELMVPYERLSEVAKDLDRGTVRAVYRAIARLRYGT